MIRVRQNRSPIGRIFWVWLLVLLLGLAACGDQTESESRQAARKPNRTEGAARGIRVVGKRPSAPARQERVAVVIGNSSYKASPLKNPVNDARAIARTLERLDFSVDLLMNAGRRKMFTALSEFGRRLKKADVGLFYYAGHGIQVKGRNYLVPVDAVLETESDVEFEALDLGRVLGKMDDAGCPLNIVILDACRDNPFARSFRSSTKGLAMVDAPRGTLLAFATAPGSVAADGEGGNGIYTRFLLENITRPGLNIEEVFKRVRIGVVEATGGRQTPWESSSLMGDFYFLPGPDKAAGRQNPPASTGRGQRLSGPATTPAPAVTAAAAPPRQRAQATTSPPPAPVKTASLARVKTAPAVSKPRLSPEVEKYLRMIRSGRARDQRYAAKKIVRQYRNHRVLLNAARDELLRGYRHRLGDRHHIDAMAWLCNVLGASGEHRYAATLDRVAASTSNRKLKKYALKNRRKLP